jgi:MraZ protein
MVDCGQEVCYNSGMLLGEYAHSIDDKCRFRLPAKLKSELGDEDIVLTKGTDGCLFLFAAAELEAHFLDKLRNISVADKGAQVSLRALFSSADKPLPDNQGRLMLTAALREHAGIKKDIVTIGMGNRAEIWAAERWAVYNKSADFDTAIAALREYNL